MHSWEALPPCRLMPSGMVSVAFLSFARADLRAAGQYVCELPYGRNSRPDDPLTVLTERRGTCSTKHALLRRLAIEQGIDLVLVLGIYQMNERNTPGVGSVLRRHGLKAMPEAHCYLRFEDKHIDVTRQRACSDVEPISHFLHEEQIEPSQITMYKIGVHKSFLQQWINGRRGLGELSLAGIWAIREECIMAFSRTTIERQLL
jgi:hypothetical protein